MRSKLLSGIAALALTAGTVVASSAPASAWGWHRGGWGWGGGAVAAGIIGGAALAAATSPLWRQGYYDYAPGYAYSGYGYSPGYAYGAGYAPAYAPGYANGSGYAYGSNYGYAPAAGYGVYDYAPAPYVAAGTAVVAGGNAAYCRARYRSYNPSTGTFLGFDGQFHSCP
jgi:hypothetical protein